MGVVWVIGATPSSMRNWCDDDPLNVDARGSWAVYLKSVAKKIGEKKSLEFTRGRYLATKYILQEQEKLYLDEKKL